MVTLFRRRKSNFQILREQISLCETSDGDLMLTNGVFMRYRGEDIRTMLARKR